MEIKVSVEGQFPIVITPTSPDKGYYATAQGAVIPNGLPVTISVSNEDLSTAGWRPDDEKVTKIRQLCLGQFKKWGKVKPKPPIYRTVAKIVDQECPGLKGIERRRLIDKLRKDFPNGRPKRK